MATKFKGICKGLKYISQIFAMKDKEMEIGYPTDVKHVAHIGWDGASDTPPSWMSKFKPGPDFNTSFGGNPRDTNSMTTDDPWSSQDCDQSKGSRTFRDSPTSADVSSTTKRHRRKKKKLSSSSRSNSSVSSRLSTKSKYSQAEPTISLHV